MKFLPFSEFELVFFFLVNCQLLLIQFVTSHLTKVNFDFSSVGECLLKIKFHFFFISNVSDRCFGGQYIVVGILSLCKDEIEMP